MSDDGPLTAALRRILRPLVRVMIARGLRYPAASTLLRGLFVQVAEADFALPGRRLTDSRLSLLTGLQRRELKGLRDQPPEPVPGAGPLPRVIAAWLVPPHAGPEGPRPLSREDFAALVAGVSRDMHARTLLDELIRLGQVRAEGDRLHLVAQAFVPAADLPALMHYFGANLGDHAQAAAANLAASPAPGPHFERALHYDHLTPQDAARIESLARARLAALLAELNVMALALQQPQARAQARIRVGAYILTETGPT